MRCSLICGVLCVAILGLVCWLKMYVRWDKEYEAACAECNAPAYFIGKWRLYGENGQLSSTLTVEKTKAKRHHAPSVKCQMIEIGGDLLLLWDDGFVDMLKKEDDGAVSFLGLGEDRRVRFKLRAEPWK